MPKRDNIIASQGDACVRISDLETLQEGYWLNDAVIAYFLEVMTLEVNSAVIRIILPSVAYFISLAGKEVLDTLHLGDTRYVLLPINNAKLRGDERTPGGTHWSLLLVDRANMECIHFDSCPGMNDEPAKQMARVWTGSAHVRNICSTARDSTGTNCGKICVWILRVLSGSRNRPSLHFANNFTPHYLTWFNFTLAPIFNPRTSEEVLRLIVI